VLKGADRISILLIIRSALQVKSIISPAIRLLKLPVVIIPDKSRLVALLTYLTETVLANIFSRFITKLSSVPEDVSE